MNPFTFDWDQPVADDERDRVFDRLAHQAVGRGLATPVIWMLEIHKPLFSLAGHVGIAVSPLLAMLFKGGPEEMQKYTQLMRTRANVDLLIRRIEQKAEEQSAARI